MPMMRVEVTKTVWYRGYAVVFVSKADPEGEPIDAVQAAREKVLQSLADAQAVGADPDKVAGVEYQGAVLDGAKAAEYHVGDAEPVVNY